MTPARTLVKAHKNITNASPYLFESGSNKRLPTNAPAFPLAAAIPFKVDRHWGENVILGSMNVVVLGP